MAREVFMPKAGMDMQEGRIIRWLAETGSRVKAGEPLLEIETDKVAMEVESPADGVLLKRYFEENAVVPVATIIGYVGEEGESVPDRPAMAGGLDRAEGEAVLREEAERESRKTYEYKVAVIGAGPAGYHAALVAAKAGRKTVLFEKDLIGGIGVNRGSIPLKVYMRTARLAEDISHAEESGIRTGSGRIEADAVRIHDNAHAVAEGIRNDVISRLGKYGVEIVREEAHLIGPHHIRAGQKTYRAENVILCCGSVARRLDIPGVDQPEIIGPEKMFELTAFPRRMVIIGGGVIGCEMAAAWNRFGTEVTIVERQDRLIPTFDRDVSAEIEKSFREHGIQVITGGIVERFDRRENRPVTVLRDGSEIPGELVLLAVGRQPELSALGDFRKQLEYERGKIAVDEYCRTNMDHIYACGDITNRSILEPSAVKMGEAAALTACGVPKMVKLNRAPLCLYTMPEAAGIGLTEQQAAKRGEILVGRCPFSANGRAAASGETEGFVKVIADRGYGEILGVHVVGAAATEMIVEAKTMMDMEITVYEVADIIHPHPSWSEAFMDACAAAVGESTMN